LQIVPCGRELSPNKYQAHHFEALAIANCPITDQNPDITILFYRYIYDFQKYAEPFHFGSYPEAGAPLNIDLGLVSTSALAEISGGSFGLQTTFLKNLAFS